MIEQENKILKNKIESLKSLLEDIDDFLGKCDVQTAEEDRKIDGLRDRIFVVRYTV